jgi:hypothetical protein
MVALHAATLPLASKLDVPIERLGGSLTAAIGLSAAFTAFNALTIPAPQVVVVQAHSTFDEVLLEHTGVPVGCGYGLALASIRAISCAGVRFPFTERINAAIPETMGAEKLVPKLTLV